MTDALPRHPEQAELVSTDDHWALSLDRLLPHPAEAVWAALTRAREVPAWAPFAPSRDLDSPGPVELPETAEAEPVAPARVVRADPARLLVLSWDRDELRFALSADVTGTALRLTHTFADRSRAPSYAAGWHLCLAALDGILAGLDLPKVTGEAATAHGWEELHDRYGTLLEEV
ncbi:SRPBCC domain-containing protein [Streptomyces sp. NBC_01803]|uniref:SRPBCC domain-containing protein n=1 Tax=Streptomyces sp. NBC_01803 TaxID=2975946 RepID=UPI002DDA3BFA|nr:SRPBCC domain-containing protein [Streptomyces sp. NBC_01803]WSA43783.1 SRPBCC domain-containing protein [Streptomyces sp. NBC_01803]